MSTSLSPSGDLILNARIPAVEPLFTTFSARHFVKPGQFTQPVMAQPVKAIAAVQPASFAGCFTEVYAAAPIDLDYDEPHAVVEAELEVVQPTGSVHQIELSVARVAENKSQRSAA